MELGDDTLRVGRTLSALGEAVIEFTRVLDAEDVGYVIVSGYVVILTGRSRATEDVDVVIEPLSRAETDELVAALRERGYWGMAMPLDEAYPMLRDGDRIRVAREDEIFPNFEIWFASNELERTALANALTAELDDAELRISPIELQIAYKLHLAQRAGSPAGKDFEDALHLYRALGEQLKGADLERYVEILGVEPYHDELRSD